MGCERSGCVLRNCGARGVRAGGFTLIEMLITVTVLAIAVAVVIPEMSQTGVIRVQSAVRTITSDIAIAQTEAMAYQTHRALYFGVIRAPGDELAYEEGNGYGVFEPTTEDLTLDNMAAYSLYMPEKRGQPYIRTFAGAQNFGGARIEDASFDGEPVLKFDELGGPVSSVSSGDPSNGGSVVVRSDAYKIAYRISVEAMTGRTTVERMDEPEGEVVAEGG